MNILTHLKKNQQQIMPLFNGAFIENKPIPFPEKGTTKAYSNLFYWAHLQAKETSEFPLHPHEGFEIMTFVFKGSLEHFDTATNIWTPLDAGGVQVIQAASGIKHSERIIKGTELFQIWFDPDFSFSLSKTPTYKDYAASKFLSSIENGVKKLFYLNDKGPVYFETKGLEITKLLLDNSKHELNLDSNYTYSFYLLNGELDVNENIMIKDDFLVFNKASLVKLTSNTKAELFIIKSPTVIEYKRFIERY